MMRSNLRDEPQDYRRLGKFTIRPMYKQKVNYMSAFLLLFTQVYRSWNLLGMPYIKSALGQYEDMFV